MDGFITDWVEMTRELSDFRSFWSLLIRRISEFNNSFACVASLAPTPPMPMIRIGSVI
jgi:hypothetical protein